MNNNLNKLRRAMRRSRGRAGGEHGGATAELAVVTPAIVLLLVLMIAGLGAANVQVQLNGATSDAARLLARGELNTKITERMSQLGPLSTIESSSESGLACVTAAKAAPMPLQAITLSAKSCVLEAHW